MLMLMLLAGGVVQAKSTRTVTTNFEWERSVEIGETSIPFKVLIPVSLSVDGLPDKAKPGEDFQLILEVTPSGGAYMQMTDKTFNIDDAIERATVKPYEIDLSALGPITTSILTTILEDQLKLPRDAAENLASAAQDRTKLILSCDLNIDTVVKGGATASPSSLSTWFNEASDQTLKIRSTAKADEKIEVSYTVALRLLLKMDLAEEVYSDPAAGPIMKKLAQLVGLPLTKELGSTQGKEKLIHTINVQVPTQITFEMVLVGIGVAAAIALIVIFIVIKHPRKPFWR